MPPTRENRRARGAVGALFLTNGALFANMAPRLPEFKAQLGLEAGAYGLLVTAWPVGAIIAGLAAGSMIRRFGSAAVAVFAGAAGGLASVVASFVLGGAMDAIADVGQNAQGLQVQRRYGRPILNSFHALWSVGAVLGGLMVAAAMALGLPLGAHFAISWLIFATVALTAWKFCLPARGPIESVQELAVDAGSVRAFSRGRIVVRIAALVLIALAGIMVEDAGNSKATLCLGSLGAPSALAASGYIALVGAQLIGRILGDGLVRRFGQRLIVQLGAALVAGDMGLALAFPSIPGSLPGLPAGTIADEFPGDWVEPALPGKIRLIIHPNPLGVATEG